jgi:hypothetical protein
MAITNEGDRLLSALAIASDPLVWVRPAQRLPRGAGRFICIMLCIYLIVLFDRYLLFVWSSAAEQIMSPAFVLSLGFRGVGGPKIASLDGRDTPARILYGFPHDQTTQILKKLYVGNPRLPTLSECSITKTYNPRAT